MNETLLIGIIILSIFAIVLLSILIFQTYQTIIGIRYTPQLLLGFVFIFLGSLFQLLVFLLDGTGYFLESKFVQSLVRILFGFAMYYVYLHYEALTTINPPFYRKGIMISLLSINISILVFAIWQDVLITDVDIFLTLILSFTGIFSISFAFFVAYKSYKLMRDRATSFELIAIFILICTFILQGSVHLIRILGFPFNTDNSQLLPFDRLSEVFALTGMLILMLNSFYYTDYVYRLPVPVHDFLIYNSSGLLVYSRSVKIPGIDLIYEKQLITGMFTAIAALIKETLGTDSKLEEINVNNYQIFFTQMVQDSGTLAVIATKGTYFLKQSIKRFLLTITEELCQKINEPVVETVELAKELDLLLKRSFPYLTIDYSDII